ncbi:MAG: flagellar hook-basal body complex protein [Alphaproteobacteria bacterium]|nr:flagellar hook-basal body complex protein [Alphaproteobacteria bacterium]MBO6627493.1 flagellar hook-basal body complex protein [Alphaproteobacteria bacterium]MDF1627133.1 flagellar hook-basal body complex protein [Parvibaculaceae bacterium]
MSFNGAMSTAISGIRAQATALAHISDNIANSQTTAFKRTDTSFYDSVTLSGENFHLPGTTYAQPAYTNNVQGAINSSSVKTNMAINGNGFFVVSEAVGSLDNQPVLLNVDRYTRQGDFELDRNGYLVNSSNYYLQGVAIDVNTGNPVGDVPSPIKIERQFLNAKQTTSIDYEANLPAYPKTVNSQPTTPGSELLLAGTFANDPTTQTAGAANGFVQAGEESLFLDRSLAGGSITVYDDLGAPLQVQLRWAKIENAAGSAGIGGGDTWNLFYKTSDTATGVAAKWTNVGQDYVFANGQLAPAVNSTTVTGLTINGNNVGNVVLDHGTSNVTQFEDTRGSITVNALDQDGFASGSLLEVSVSNNGRIVGTYSNGKSVDLAEVTLVRFNDPNKLQKLDGGAFAATQSSGEALIGAGGSIVAAALEGSNVDIADEFSKLIITQQAYSANTRIVTTADEMYTEALNMKR